VIRVNYQEDFFLPDGFVGERPILTFETILHYAAVFIGGPAIAFAYVERAKSDKDRPGQYGYAATKYRIECVLGLGGSCGYVPVGFVADVVSTIESEGLLFFYFIGSRLPRTCRTIRGRLRGRKPLVTFLN